MKYLVAYLKAAYETGSAMGLVHLVFSALRLHPAALYCLYCALIAAIGGPLNVLFRQEKK